MDSSPKNTEQLYISVEDKDILLNFLLEKWGLDFTNYSEASVRRRVAKLLNEFNLKNIEELIEYLTNYPSGRKIFLEKFTVNVTEMFRDPFFFEKLKQFIFPLFEGKEIVNIWSAGCSSGEEVLSLAVLLQEAGLLDNCRITGTDINESMLERARSRTYKMRHVKTYLKPYIYAGGQFGLEKYFVNSGGNVVFDPELYRNTCFELNNMIVEAPKGEFDLVLCRNVLIYFNQNLQSKVLDSFSNKLAVGGHLALGSKESTLFYKNREIYYLVDSESKIYRKIR